MLGVFTDDRIAGVPVALWLGVEPVHGSGLLVHRLDDPALRGVVVVPGVAENHDRGTRPDLVAVLLPEDTERMAVVGVAIDPDDISFGVDPVHGFVDVLNAFEHVGDLIKAVDEHKGSNLRELPRNGVHEVKGEASKRSD